MKKLILSPCFLLVSSLVFAQDSAYEENKEDHFLFLAAFIFILFVCVAFVFIGLFLYRKGRSNRRRLHDLRLDMKELKEDFESTKLLIQKLQESSAQNQSTLNQVIPTKKDFNPIHQRIKHERPIVYDSSLKYASSVNMMDNSFFSVSDTPTETSVFVLNIDKSNRQEATFRIYEGALDKIKQVEDFLNQACEIDKNDLSDADVWGTIHVKKEGVCRNINDKWEVIERLNLVFN